MTTALSGMAAIERRSDQNVSISKATPDHAWHAWHGMHCMLPVQTVSISKATPDHACCLYSRVSCDQRIHRPGAKEWVYQYQQSTQQVLAANERMLDDHYKGKRPLGAHIAQHAQSFSVLLSDALGTPELVSSNCEGMQALPARRQLLQRPVSFMPGAAWPQHSAAAA